MQKYKFITVAIIFLVSIAVFWGIKNALFQNTSDVKIAVSRTPLSAPIYIADALGYFENAGLNVELIEKDGGNICFDLMMDGGADFATSSDSVIMFNGFKQNNFENIATFVQSNHDVKVFTKKSSGIKNGEGLKGKKVAIVKASASEYFLDLFLAVDGVDYSEVVPVDMPATEMLTALNNNRVDAIVVWEPFAFKVITQENKAMLLLSKSNLYELTFNLLTKKETTLKDPQTSVKVLSALKQAVEYIHTNETKAQQIIIERLGLKQAFIEKIWRDYLYDLVLNRSLLLTLENEARWAINRQLTDNKKVPDYRQLINPEPLKSVSPYAISF